MPHINLLPWREELRKRRQKEFLATIAGSVVLAIGVVFLVHLQFNSMLKYQETRNQFLQQQIAELDKKIAEIRQLDAEKQRLLARMRIIQQLQASRPEIVHLFDELVATIPDGVSFKKLGQQGRRLTLEGVAQSASRVSSLMRKLEDSGWLSKPELVEIVKNQQGKGDILRMNRFKLHVGQSRPKDQPKEGSS
jgi:type IV pilus assembly protein PilN